MRYTYTIERIEIMKHTAFTMAGAGQRASLTDLRTNRFYELHSCENSIKESTVLRHCEPACRRGNPRQSSRLLVGWSLKSLIQPLVDVPQAPVSPRANTLAMTKNIAFTMAEILLSLTIIGVVAAITLPSLTGNINERTWNTQRKALYARFSQAIALMPALNGYGTLKEESSSGAGDAVDTAAETFITSGLAKVLKINNICDNEHLQDCGITSEITTLYNSKIDTPKTMKELNGYMAGSYSASTDSFSLINTNAAAFETQNGESIIVYYQPNCVGSLNENGAGLGGMYIAPKVCANFIYDLNGNRGPNTVGKDIGFLTLLYPSDPKIVAPQPAYSKLSETYALKPTSGISASKACTNYDVEYRLPNVDELSSMVVNQKLITSGTLGSIWSSSPVTNSNGGYWRSWGNLGIDDDNPNREASIWCIKR